MKNIGLAAILALITLSQNAWSYGTGVSSYPLLIQKRYIGAEFTGITSTGGGIGVQARYTEKLTSSTIVDAGLGMGGGELTSRLFAAIDFELYPDYQQQPRISLKAKFENAKEFGVRTNSFGIAPTFSKGFNFWGTEAYPFVSLPYNIRLDSTGNTYSTNANLNIGVTAALPFSGYKHLMATVEGTVKIKDSYSGLFFGITYPLN
jgi:hypothetical protein